MKPNFRSQGKEVKHLENKWAVRGEEGWGRVLGHGLSGWEVASRVCSGAKEAAGEMNDGFHRTGWVE